MGNENGPIEHGFDHFYSAPANTEPSESEGGKGEYELTRAALDFIEAEPDRPFALYLGHNTPHIPYTAKSHLIDRNEGAFEPVYAALIETLDDTVGLIMDRLEDLGIAENTILVFTSDNGGLHVPEGPHPRVTHNTPFRAGEGFVYEGGNRGPLIIRWPGRIEAGRVVDAPVNNIDWIPTLVELVGGTAPDPLALPALHQSGRTPDRCDARRSMAARRVLRRGDGRALRLGIDIGEARDLAADHPNRVREMSASLDRWRRANEVQYNRPNPDCDEERFRALYKDVDVSRFDPRRATDEEWSSVHEWREKMNAAVSEVRE